VNGSIVIVLKSIIIPTCWWTVPYDGNDSNSCTIDSSYALPNWTITLWRLLMRAASPHRIAPTPSRRVSVSRQKKKKNINAGKRSRFCGTPKTSSALTQGRAIKLRRGRPLNCSMGQRRFMKRDRPSGFFKKRTIPKSAPLAGIAERREEYPRYFFPGLRARRTINRWIIEAGKTKLLTRTDGAFWNLKQQQSLLQRLRVSCSDSVATVGCSGHRRYRIGRKTETLVLSTFPGPPEYWARRSWFKRKSKMSRTSALGATRRQGTITSKFCVSGVCIIRFKITRMRILVMLVTITVQVGALSISHWDLEGANKTCDWKANCLEDERTPKSLRDSMREADWRDRNCMCDRQCAQNLYCAMCHDDHYDLHVWHPRLECNSLPTQLPIKNFSRLLEYDGKYWGIPWEGKFHPCNIDPVVPEGAMNFIRRCQPGLIRTCAVNWTNVEVRSRCEAYTVLVYSGDRIYRNPHCAVCNNDPLQHLSCSPTLLRSGFTKEFSLVAFSMLFDLSGTQVGLTTVCGDHQLFDPFFKRCRSIITELNSTKDNYRLNDDGTLYNVIPIENPSSHPIRSDKNCSKFVLEKDEFQVENTSMYVPQYKKRFSPEEFEFREDGRVEICVGDLGVKLVNKFGIYMGYVTYAGLGVSIIFLLLHLTAFSLVSELRNLSGKNLASLCVALLIAYTAFMAGQVLEGTACAVDGIITFYAFLASFFWTSTMSFDVWRTLRLATAELRVSSGKQWRKFFVYSIWSWCAPAVVVCGALWVEFTPANIDEQWRPSFGKYMCWFGHGRPLLAFFASPLAVIMFFNIVFFVSSARMIYSTTSTTKFTASATTQRDFRLYVRLSVVMGLAWTTGLVAGAFDVEILWYVFIALNTLQGGSRNVTE
ncbi:unnamed protein product, partial [Nesidiocoris tenuis]